MKIDFQSIQRIIIGSAKIGAANFASGEKNHEIYQTVLNHPCDFFRRGIV